MSSRVRFIILSLACLANGIAMFLVAFGAAAGGPRVVLLWPAVAMMVLCALMLAAIAAGRGAETGHSPVSVFIATLLGCVVGPFITFLLLYLAIKSEVSSPQPVQQSMPWRALLVILGLPWAVLVAFGLGRV